MKLFAIGLFVGAGLVFSSAFAAGVKSAPQVKSGNKLGSSTKQVNTSCGAKADDFDYSTFKNSIEELAAIVAGVKGPAVAASSQIVPRNRQDCFTDCDRIYSEALVKAWDNWYANSNRCWDSYYGRVQAIANEILFRPSACMNKVGRDLIQCLETECVKPENSHFLACSIQKEAEVERDICRKSADTIEEKAKKEAKEDWEACKGKCKELYPSLNPVSLNAKEIELLLTSVGFSEKEAEQYVLDLIAPQTNCGTKNPTKSSQ